ncbi:hypothetical protein EDS67_05740 [candidate division KSB1 bacterium]|nr:MAG: hypothetical protein EDS67_05740 [candidate division KSB1 bacterium]MBC6951876.1 hypothetical protein [candidate division KSB1 bacterium]MCE7940357.1 hypothetical protein [Chlorobi bacterium CHB1]MDL1875622.1 hypothetical protein [Cytophagia bacterium CHB2]NUM73269.1 hypothetical protein [candidate division KSB1 bacterium]
MPSENIFSSAFEIFFKINFRNFSVSWYWHTDLMEKSFSRSEISETCAAGFADLLGNPDRCCTPAPHRILPAFLPITVLLLL